MKYRDKKFRFTVDIPDGWVKQGAIFGFFLTGGRAAFAHKSRGATVNVSVGELDRPEWQDQQRRAEGVTDFLMRAPHQIGQVRIRTDHEVAEEPNTVWAEFIETASIAGGATSEHKAGFIAAVHGGSEYVIQWSAQPEFENETQLIIESFKFDR